jgi:DNA-binding CsgD family transcriptional regulator
MTILTRQEKERLVLDLYNQGKTYRQISKEARISPRDIGVILNKVMEEKNAEGLKEGQDNLNSEKNQNQEQQLHLSLSTQAYKLFSEGKTPLEVAIELNLGESEATKFYKEYWKLKQLHNLNTVYEEIKDDIEPFLKLYQLSKAAGMTAHHVIGLLKIANNNLPEIEWRYERLKREVNTLEVKKHQSFQTLSYFKSQIERQSQALNSYRIYCEDEKSKIGYLQNEKIAIENVITQFKNNNEEYLNKIKQAVEEKVISLLMNSKIFLNFAAASVIESLRRNPELCNFVLNDAYISYYGSNYLSLTLPGEHQQSFSCLNDDIYAAVILEEAEKLYNELTTELTNRSIAAAAAIR